MSRPRLTAGRIAYLLYHRPLAEVRRSIRSGGPLEQWRDARGRRRMERAAWELPPPRFPAAPFELHLLTGRAYLEQTLFCLWSFAQAGERIPAAVLYDDGTLSAALTGKFRRVFPSARIVSQDESIERLQRTLPPKKFPILHERFAAYPHIRKLLAVHAGSTGWKLVLDSDILFFRRPDFLLDWLAAPTRPLYALDLADAYGYPRALLEKIAGAPLPRRVNAGLCGLRSESIDWDQVERWCLALLAAAGPHYLLEQALVALLLAGTSPLVAPARNYIVGPAPAEAQQPRAVLHHYVAETKRWYFRSAWLEARRLLSSSDQKSVNNFGFCASNSDNPAFP